jgi:hypothetical protein
LRIILSMIRKKPFFQRELFSKLLDLLIEHTDHVVQIGSEDFFIIFTHLGILGFFLECDIGSLDLLIGLHPSFIIIIELLKALIELFEHFIPLHLIELDDSFVDLTDIRDIFIFFYFFYIF